MSQTWRALTLSEGCGQILRLWPTEKLQNATVGTTYPPFCLRFTLPVPGFYILNLAVVGHASEVGISCVLSTIHVADSASDEKFRGSLKRVVQNPLHPEASSQVPRQVSRRQAPEAWSVLGSSPQVP